MVLENSKERLRELRAHQAAAATVALDGQTRVVPDGELSLAERLDKPTDTAHRQELVREADNMPVEDEGDWDVGPLNVVDPRERHGSLDRSGDDET